MLVCKRSGKPFKSGRRINTVAGETTNPHSGKPGYTFVEDDSIVDVRTCDELSPDDPYVIQELAIYATR